MPSPTSSMPVSPDQTKMPLPPTPPPTVTTKYAIRRRQMGSALSLNVSKAQQPPQQPASPAKKTTASPRSTATSPAAQDNSSRMAWMDLRVPYAAGPIRVMDGLYLGSERSARDVDTLLRENIGYIINVGQECGNYFECGWDVVQEADVKSSATGSDDGLDSSSPVYNELNVLQRELAQAERLRLQSSNTISTNPILDRARHRLGHQKSRSDVGAMVKSFERASMTPPPPPHYLKLPWTHQQDNILTDLPRALAFIDKAHKEGRSVLVHCKQGVSRSASLVLAVVMKRRGWTFDRAYAMMKKLSPAVSPHLHFVYQLKEFEGKVVGQTTKNDDE